MSLDDFGMKRERRTPQKMRITFGSGKVICHKRVQFTMLDALREIGVERFPEITLEIGGTRPISQEVPPKYRDYMEPIVDGWYLNCQSDTAPKCLQLKAIATQLGIDMKAEIGDFETDCVRAAIPKKTRDSRLMVKFPDGEYVAEISPTDAFSQTVFKIGIKELKKKNIQWAGKPFISSFQQFKNQVQVDTNAWMIVPGATKDKAKMLTVIGAMMHIKLDVMIL